MNPLNTLPDYSNRGWDSQSAGNVNSVIAPYMRYRQKNGAITPQRGIVNFRGYQVPGALLAQMNYEGAVNQGRINPFEKYFGGNRTPGMYSSDASRIAYLQSLNPFYSGSGAISKWQQASQRAEQFSGELSSQNQQTAQQMGIKNYRPDASYRIEQREASGALSMESAKKEQERLQKQQEMQYYGQQAQEGMSGRRSWDVGHQIGGVMQRHLDKLSQIMPTESNLGVSENVVSQAY